MTASMHRLWLTVSALLLLKYVTQLYINYTFKSFNIGEVHLLAFLHTLAFIQPWHQKSQHESPGRKEKQGAGGLSSENYTLLTSSSAQHSGCETHTANYTNNATSRMQAAGKSQPTGNQAAHLGTGNLIRRLPSVATQL